MMDLADEIELLRKQMILKHSDLSAKVEELDRLAFEQDAALMRSLEATIEGQGRRASDIHRMLKLIQARVGFIPAEEHLPLYEAGSPRPTIAAPEADDGARATAVRFAPPFRAESTRGDDLGLYDGSDHNPIYGPN